MVEAQLFRRRDDETALNAIEAALLQVAPEEDVKGMMAKLRRRPLIRWMVLRSVREEAVAAGLVTTAAIDWENLGDFLVKIAPIILEILMMFL